MKRSKIYILLFSTWAIFSYSLIGCINLPIGGKAAQKSDSISVVAPTKPYEKSNTKQVDQGWIHPKTGSTISYLTECSDSNDASLKQMEVTALSGLQNLKVMESKELSFSDRKALRTRAQGDVDGVLIDVDLLLLKKNGCRYTFTLTGFPQTFTQMQNDFNQFLKGVRIQ